MPMTMPMSAEPMTPLDPSTLFMPHGHCYLWTPGIVWMEVVSNALVALAYYSIPIVLFFLVRARKDLPYPHVFVLFGLFITSCGTGHLLDIVTIWHPIYWFKAIWDSFTGAISVMTALVLGPLLPRLLKAGTVEEVVQKQTIDQLERQKRDLEEANLRLEEASRVSHAQMLSMELAVATLAERESRIRELREALERAQGPA